MIMNTSRYKMHLRVQSSITKSMNTDSAPCMYYFTDLKHVNKTTASTQPFLFFKSTSLKVLNIGER